MSENITFTPAELPDVATLQARKGPGLDNPLSLIADVEVKLEFIMGTTTLTVGELTALSAGQAIKLDEDQATRVGIRLNGIDIGYGMLVTVDGVLGVQIKHVER